MAVVLNPYENVSGMKWFKGDLHLHTDASSDGTSSREEMKARLLECGFDFAAFADHDCFYSEESGGSPLILGNSEIDSGSGHVLGLLAGTPPAAASGTLNVINAVKEAGGIPVLSHPKIGEFSTGKNHWTYTSRRLNRELTGYAGMEIYTRGVKSGFQTAVDRLDAVWAYSHRNGLGPAGIWGLAASDAHDSSGITPEVGILAAAHSCDRETLREALARGRFYSLAGSPARFRSITVRDGVLGLEVSGAKVLKVFGAPAERGSGDNRLLAIAWADKSGRIHFYYRINGDEGFLRAEAIDRNGNHIYLNPLAVV